MRKLIKKLDNYYFGVIFGALMVTVLSAIMLYFQLTAPSIPVVVKVICIGFGYYRLRIITNSYYAAMKDH